MYYCSFHQYSNQTFERLSLDHLERTHKQSWVLMILQTPPFMTCMSIHECTKGVLETTYTYATQNITRNYLP